MRWRYAIAIVVVAGTVGACGSNAPVNEGAPPRTTSTTASTTGAPVTTTTTTAATTSSSAPATTTTTTPPRPLVAHGQQAGRDAIPWAQVGTGWSVATWGPNPAEPLSFGLEDPSAGDAAPTALFLLDPIGGRYLVTSLEGWLEPPGPLVDWSGDGRRVVFEHVRIDGTAATTIVTELDMTTGAGHRFAVAGRAHVSFTRPLGQALFLIHEGPDGQPSGVERVDTDGHLQKVLPIDLPGVGRFGGTILPTADGTAMVMSAAGGLALVSNGGRLVRTVPLASVGTACAPVRWWGPALVLTRCEPPAGSASFASRLWLVPIGDTPPASPTSPRALTAQLSGDGPDFGDLDAWRVGGATYLQAAGACGSRLLMKLAADGTSSPVHVPGVQGDDVGVVGVAGGRLQLTGLLDCAGGISLFWFDPRTMTTDVVLGPPASGGNVSGALLYNRFAAE